MKKIFLLLFISLPTLAQTDFTSLSWEFRGPMNYNLGAKEVIDIASDPNNSKKLWACTLEDGLLFNDNVIDENSNWQKSSLANRRVYKLKFHPNKPLIAFAIGDFVNWKTTDGGKTWSEIINIRSTSRFYDIWVSKSETVVAATKNEVFTSIDEGKTWKKILELENLSTIKQLWVQENERIYVLKDDNKGLYSDANYSKWNDITFTQMRIEEMPFPELEEFHAYVVQSGEVLHGFTTERRKILARNSYSIDGGQSYQFLLSPDSLNEVVFVGNTLVFATKKGVFVYEATKLQERNKGQLAGEFKIFAIRDFAGDNYFSGITTKGLFMMSNVGIGSAVEISSQSERYNYITNANPYQSQISYFSNESFVAVEEDKLNYVSLVHLVGQKIIPVKDNISLYLTNNGEIGRWIGNKTGNLAEGKSEIFEAGVSPMIDIYYNPEINTVYGLYKNGKFVRIKNPDALLNTSMLKSYYQLPFDSFDKGYIEEISTDGTQILVTDKTNNLWLTTDEGNTWKKINTDAIKDLKINHLEYGIKYQKLFLATETGVYLGENVLNGSPKWTNINKEIGQQPCIFIKLRPLDNQLAVMTRYKGIYSTVLFTEPNQIITYSPSYLNLNSSQYTYFMSEKLLVTICDNSKIKIDFTSNIPENPEVEYVVEISDDNGNFPLQPFILQGKSTKSPVEVEFVKPQDPRRNGFRFRVLARGAVQSVGTPTPEILISNQKEFVAAPQNLIMYCENEVVPLQPKDGNSTGQYFWQKDGTLIAGITSETYKTSQIGTYTRTAELNGCILKSTINVKSDLNLKPFLKPNISVIYAGNTCVVDSFKLSTDFKLGYKYVWYRDNLVINNANNADIFVKDKSKYKIFVESQEGCASISEEIQLKTCENGLDNRAVILNPPLIAVDKKSIYPNEKAILSVETCENVNLQWLKNDQLILGANQKTLEVSEIGNYALQIEKFGCKATTSVVKISVETILAVGEENPNFNIKVYPNPTEEKIFVSIPTQINIPIDVKMTDISGKLINNYDFSASNSQFIDLKSFQTGVYFLIFEMQGKRVVKKVIKNK